MNSDPRIDRFEESWDDVDVDTLLAERVHRLEHFGMPIARERDDDSIDVVSTNDLVEIAGIAEDLKFAKIFPSLPRVRVDVPDEIDAVLEVLAEFSTDELPDVAGADDDRVLPVQGVTTCDRACDSAGGGDGRNREKPEDGQLLLARISKAEEPHRRVEKPDPDGDQVEHVGEVVDAGMCSPFLVAVVEAVRLRGEDPGRDRGHEGQRLVHSHRADQVALEDVGDADKRRCQPDYVGRDEQPTYEPAASTVSRRRDSGPAGERRMKGRDRTIVVRGKDVHAARQGRLRFSGDFQHVFLRSALSKALPGASPRWFGQGNAHRDAVRWGPLLSLVT